MRALLIALRLKDSSLLQHVVLVTPGAQTQTVAAALPRTFVPQLLTQLAELMATSPHVEFLLTWVRGGLVAALLAAGCRLLPAGRWLSDAGCRPLAAWLLAAGERCC